MSDLLSALAASAPVLLAGLGGLAWGTWRSRRRGPTITPALRASATYRTLAASDGERAADGAIVLAREAVAAERARVLAIVGAVDGASNYVEVERACKAIVKGIEGGAR